MREISEIVKDNRAIIDQRIADFENRILIAKACGNLMAARNIERQKELYLKQRGIKA